MSSNAGTSQIADIIVGVIIGAIVTALGVFLQFMLTERRDKRRDNEAKERRRTIAYAHLNESILRIEAKTQPKQAQLTEEEFNKLQEIVASYYDVLNGSTVKGWNVKRIIRRVAGRDFQYEIDLEEFCQDVKREYAKMQTAEGGKSSEQRTRQQEAERIM